MTEKEQLDYLKKQNLFLRDKLRKLTEKYKIMETEFDRLLEENNNFRMVRNKGKILWKWNQI